MGYLYLQWALHDKIASRTPKCGELVAFEGSLTKFLRILLDEAWIEFAITKELQNSMSLMPLYIIEVLRLFKTFKPTTTDCLLPFRFR